MGNLVIIDTGPLVAIIDQRDSQHDWVIDQLKVLEPPFLTCEAVVSESLFLLTSARQGVPTLLTMMQEDLIRLAFKLDDHLAAVTRLIAKHQAVPMSLADASLVRMSELHDRAHIFTLDSDFKRYRRHGRQAIPLIYPAP